MYSDLQTKNKLHLYSYSLDIRFKYFEKKSYTECNLNLLL